jgi:hypothetical protein
VRAPLLVAGALALGGCGYFVGEGEAVRALEAHGFSGVRVTARHEMAPELFGCGRDDAAAFDATATNPAGRQVEAVVCVGWPFKGATVRTK